MSYSIPAKVKNVYHSLGKKNWTTKSFPLQFLELDGGTDEQCENIVKCNIESVNAMTSLVLPQMADRKSGAVINISSLSSGSTCPLLTVYSATKAYVDFFTRGLAMEYESQGSKMIPDSLPTERIFLLNTLRRCDCSVCDAWIRGQQHVQNTPC